MNRRGESSSLTTVESQSGAYGAISYPLYVWRDSTLVTVPLPTGWTATNPVKYRMYYYRQSGTRSLTTFYPNKTTDCYVFTIPHNLGSNLSEFANSYFSGIYATIFKFNDVSVRHADFTVPRYNQTTMSFNQAPHIIEDTSTYRTSSPSLRMSVLNANNSGRYYYKSGLPIRFPVESGTSYSISGYVRCTDSSITNGQCSVLVYDPDGTLKTTQAITTGAYNAWEQFSYTYAATATGFATLVWQAQIDAADSTQQWFLDDLVIS